MLNGMSMNRINTISKLSSVKRDLYIFLLLLFLLSASYFYFFGNSLFFYQENRSLFIFSKEYFGEFLLRPGGLTEFIGNFIKQVYYSNIYGSLVVSVFLLLFAAILIRMYKMLSGGKTVWFIIITGPACLLLLMQTLNDHFIHYTIGYLFLTLFMQASVYFSSKRLGFLVPILFPIFFYLAGSLALVFPVFYAIYCLLFKKGSSRFKISGILVVVAILSLVVFQKFLFLQAPGQYLKYPFPIFYPKELHTGVLIRSQK